MKTTSSDNVAAAHNAAGQPVAPPSVYDRRISLKNPQFRFCALSVLWLLRVVLLFGLMAFSSSAQVQQAWVARYNNGIPSGTNQAVKMVLDTNGNIYITGPSQNTNGNLGYNTIKYSPSGSQLWASRYDSTNYSSATPVGLALDNSNNVIITGTAVTAKYDTNGNQLWTAPYSASGLAVDVGGNVYVTGFGGSFNTEKLNAKGSNVWGVTYTDIGPTISQAVLVDNQTNVYVAGSDSYNSFSQGGVIEGYDCQLAVLKYDLNGNLLWKAGYADHPTEGTVSVAGATLDQANNVYVSANESSYPFQTIVFSNNGVVAALPKPAYSGKSHSLALDHNLCVFVTGQVPYAVNEGYVYYYGTFKFQTNVIVWSKYFPNPPYSSSVANATTVDQANNVYVTGYSPGTNSGNDIVTIKYDNNGNQLWVQRYNGPGNGDDEANAIAVDASGNVYVTGYDTTAAGGTEMVTIKYSPSPTGSQQTNHAFLLQTQGEPGQSFDIQATTNFTTWLDLGQTNADTNGHLQFLDTNASLFNQRFYTTKPQ